MNLGRLALITQGSFLMGATDPQADTCEQPVHPVQISTIAVGTTPVTNREFATFCQETGYTVPEWQKYATAGREEHPAVCVSWEDALRYNAWLSQKTNLLHQLPTEAEWEKSARGKLEQKLFPWGDELPTPATASWQRWGTEIGTTPVASYAPNAYGLFDMAGNVWNWCQDDYQADSYQEPRRDNPIGSEGTLRCRRGGAWNINEPFRMRCGNRGRLSQNERHSNIGFRVCVPVYALPLEKQVKVALHCISQRVTTDGGRIEVVALTGSALTLHLDGTCTVCPKILHSQNAIRNDLLAALPELQDITFI